MADPVSTIPRVRQRQVLVVDDDPWTRAGLVARLEHYPELLLEARTIDDALRRGADARQPDAIIVDVVSKGDAVDRFRGVRVIERICGAMAQHPVLVVAVGPAQADELLSVRVAEAGGGPLHAWEDIDEHVLRRAVASGRPQNLIRDLSEIRTRAGLAEKGEVNTFLAVLERNGEMPAFAPGVTQRSSGLPRRRSMAIRRMAVDVAGLRPVARPPSVDAVSPSWREVRSFVNRARGFTPA
jgi:CheY-like chemotaxis protein